MGLALEAARTNVEQALAGGEEGVDDALASAEEHVCKIFDGTHLSLLKSLPDRKETQNGESVSLIPLGATLPKAGEAFELSIGKKRLDRYSGSVTSSSPRPKRSQECNGHNAVEQGGLVLTLRNYGEQLMHPNVGV